MVKSKGDSVKRQIETVARLLGLDRLIFYYVFLKDLKKNRAANCAFSITHPDYPAPPDFLRFDVTATTSLQYYYQTGEETAAVIANDILNCLNVEGPLKICEWGCGPGRILYFLKRRLEGFDVAFTGTDMYDPSISWAREALGQLIDFRLNRVEPPLDLPENAMDAVFAVSVFTHLSEKLSAEWMKEIIRVLKPGGVFWFTSHGGTKHHHKFSDAKLKRLQEGKYVSISNRHMGSQMYEGIHPELTMRSMIEDVGAKFLSYKPCGLQKYQDIWIVRKK